MGDISDQSNDISIHDNVTHDAVTTENVSGKRGLHTYLINPDLSISSGAKIRYTEMSKNVSLTQGSYQTIYSDTTPGKVYSLNVLFKLDDVDVKVSLDGTAIIDGINVNDIKSNYLLNANTGNIVQLPRFIYSYGGTGLFFEFPAPANYATSLIVEARSNIAGNEIERGLVVSAVD